MSLWPADLVPKQKLTWFLKVKSKHFVIQLKFIWYDIWIGVYIKKDSIYICIIPMLPIKITWWNI